MGYTRLASADHYDECDCVDVVYGGDCVDDNQADVGEPDASVIDRMYEENLQLQARILMLETSLESANRKIEQQQEVMQQLQTVALLSDGDVSRCVAVRTSVPARVNVPARVSDEDDDILDAVRDGDLNLFRIRLLSSVVSDEAETFSRVAASALVIACQHGRIDVAEFLLDRKVDAQVQHNSPLQWAAQRGDEPLTRLLLKHGADPRALNNCPLRLATRMGHYAVASILTNAIKIM
jgi:ankyrin repeat protein